MFLNTFLNYNDLKQRFFAHKALVKTKHGTKIDSTASTSYYPINCKGHEQICKVFLLDSNDSFRNAKIVEQLGEEHISKSTFFTKDIKTRQTIARTLTKIPLELKEDYESLLNDKSYITIENALFNLWRNFPEDRAKYFNLTKHISGFNNKNVRLLWLALHLVSPEMEDKKIRSYYNELTNYTSPKYSFEVRQNAFQYLHQIQACNDVCKENLKQATTHHNWRFKQFAQDLLNKQSQ